MAGGARNSRNTRRVSGASNPLRSVGSALGSALYSTIKRNATGSNRRSSSSKTVSAKRKGSR